MTIDRRTLISGAGAASGLLLATAKGAKAAPATASVEPLVKAGLDPLKVYSQMFATAEDGGECCWWYSGTLPFSVQDVGQVEAFQEDTARAERTDWLSKDKTRIRWREAGVFREFTTGEIPKSYFDPITGKATPHLSTLDGAQAEYMVSRAGSGIAVALLVAGIDVHSVTVNAAIDGDRVSLTQVERKTRVMGPTGAAPVTLRSTLKCYSSLKELQSDAPLIPAKGFYSVFIENTGKVFVAGMMQKAGVSEHLNPTAWDRIKAAAPGFFKGDRVGPVWS